MPVPSSISDLSTTPSLNSPAGTESPSTVDDYLRTQAAFIKQVDDKATGTVKATDLAAPGGSALVGFQQTSSGAVPRTSQDKLRDIVSVRDFGALNNNGTTDDSAVFQVAAASGARLIDARNLNCRINGTINIPSGQTWMLSGSTLTITSATVTVFSAQNVNDWALVGPFKIVGDGSTSGTAIVMTQAYASSGVGLTVASATITMG